MALGSITKHTATDGTVSWWVRIDAGYDPVTGKHKRPRMSFRTKKEAEAAQAQQRISIQRGTMVDQSRITLGEYLNVWLADAQKRVRPTTYRMYAYHLRHYIIPEIGAVTLQKLTPARLHAVLTASRSTNIGKVSHRLLHTAFEHAVNLGLLVANPIDRVKAPRTERPKRGAWNAVQAASFLEIAAGDAYEPLWTIALHTGLRRGELIGLRWEDVDLDAGTLFVRQQITDLPGKDGTGAPKTEADKRAIDMPVTLPGTLRTHHARQRERRLAASVWQDQGLVCTSAVGTAIGPRNTSRRFQELRAKVGLPDLT